MADEQNKDQKKKSKLGIAFLFVSLPFLLAGLALLIFLLCFIIPFLTIILLVNMANNGGKISFRIKKLSPLNGQVEKKKVPSFVKF